MRYAKSAKHRNKLIELSEETYKAEELFLDTKSRFFKSRKKSLTKAGYTLGRRGKDWQQLLLTN